MAEEKIEKPYQYQHYPMSLYKGGARDGAERTVANAEEEIAARADGFSMIDKDADAKAVAQLPEEAPKKKGK